MDTSKEKKERISRKAFDSLLEYSLTLPTGQRIGKVWKCDFNVHRTHGPDPDWRICEYVTHPDPNYVGIDYRIPEIIEEIA